MILCGLTPLFWLESRISRPSDVVIWFLYLSVVFSGAALLPFLLEPGRAIRILFLFVTGLFAVWLIPRARLPKMIGPSFLPNLPRHLWIAAILGVGAAAAAETAASFRFSFRRDIWDSIYEVREDSSAQLVESGSALAGYAIVALTSIIIPVLAIMAIRSGRRMLGVLILSTEVVFFFATASKSILFGSLYVLLFYALVRRRRHFGEWMVVGAIVVVLGSQLWDSTFGGFTATTLFPRRVFATPVVLTAEYDTFFAENPPALLGHSVLGQLGLVENRYEGGPASAVGVSLTGRTTTHANANLWADGLANFGWAGVYLASIVAGGFFLIFDRRAAGKDLAVTTSALAMPAVALSNTGVLTSLLTNGLLLALALVATMGWASRRRAAGPTVAPAGIRALQDTRR